MFLSRVIALVLRLEGEDFSLTVLSRKLRTWYTSIGNKYILEASIRPFARSCHFYKFDTDFRNIIMKTLCFSLSLLPDCEITRLRFRAGLN